MDTYTFYSKISYLLKDIEKFDSEVPRHITYQGNTNQMIEELYNASFEDAKTKILNDYENRYQNSEYRDWNFIASIPEHLKAINNKKAIFQKEIALGVYYNLKYFVEFECKEKQMSKPAEIDIYIQEQVSNSDNSKKYITKSTQNLSEESTLKSFYKIFCNVEDELLDSDQSKRLLTLKFFYIERHGKSYTNDKNGKLRKARLKTFGISPFCDLLTIAIIARWADCPWNDAERPAYYDRYSFDTLRGFEDKNWGYEYYFLYENITGFQLALTIYNVIREFREDTVESKVVKGIIPILAKMPNIYGRQLVFKEWIDNLQRIKSDQSFNHALSSIAYELTPLCDLYSELFREAGRYFFLRLWHSFKMDNDKDSLNEVTRNIENYIVEIGIKKDVLEPEHEINKMELILSQNNERAATRLRFAGIQRQIFYEIAKV